MATGFEIIATDHRARAGRLSTPHGVVDTPVFMPVGTQATVKGLTPQMLEEAGARIILGNAYHLMLRPGDELIAGLGGLHRFMNWHHPILTDSGGYQIFSLAQSRKIDDRGAVFRSHIDGTLVELTPEKAVAIQENLGSDIAMCLDECPAAGQDQSRQVLEEAVRRTIHWAERCRAAAKRPDQALFGITQGGLDLDLRGKCAAALIKLDFPGYALGGFSVGESVEQMLRVLGPAAELLPAAKPRYLMGVGTPADVLNAIDCGIDMFDCVLPTRNGRNAQAFTATGLLRLRNACHRRDPAPIESDCPCLACRNYSRAYLHHLFQADEMLGPTLLSLHNVTFYCRLAGEARQAIIGGRFAEFRSARLARFAAAV
jgi:queuine tRNA-ribosyltransferase